ncbi:MAG: hypothetical protein QNI99_20105 [Woeseiaceae bacterium]|nr:hypothetical protein [Woeseiaceae bacterium]
MNSHNDTGRQRPRGLDDKSRIAVSLSAYSHCRIRPEDIDVLAGPDTAGRLRVGWRFDHFAQHFILSADGEVRAIGLEHIA